MGFFKEKLPEWQNVFSYSVGSIQQVRDGELERTLFDGDFKDFGSLLNTGKFIIVPNVVGIYQQYKVSNASSDYIMERREIEPVLERYADLIFSLLSGRKDGVDKDLIYIVYNPETNPSVDFLRENLKDLASRVVINSFDSGSLPNFHQKKIGDLSRIVTEHFDKNPQEVVDCYFESRLSLPEGFSEVVTGWEPFGLTRMEYLLRVFKDIKKREPSA
jgi:hypothetical protein